VIDNNPSNPDPAYCDLGTKPTTGIARCLQPTTWMIIGRDPVFIR